MFRLAPSSNSFFSCSLFFLLFVPRVGTRRKPHSVHTRHPPFAHPTLEFVWLWFFNGSGTDPLSPIGRPALYLPA